MASNIDPTVPTAGSATTASVRDNFDAAKTEIEALQDKTENVTTITAYAATLLDDATAADARTTLELGTMATQSASSVAITGGSITGIADLAVADGGTGASTADVARTNLGLVIGTDVQAYDAGLADIAGLAATDGNIIVGNGTTWVAENGSTARTSLGLGSIATQAASSVAITGGAIDGTTIGGTTPDAGTFTTLTASTSVTTPTVSSPAALNLVVAAGNTFSVSVGTTSAINITSGGSVALSGELGQESLRVIRVTAVNRVDITGAATGNTPIVAAAGSDTNVSLGLSPKGTGNIVVPIANVPDYADDAAAAAGGVVVGGIYRTASVLKIRVS